MLQVRCAHPTGTGEPGQPLRRCAPAPPFAPTQLFELRRCCAWLIKIREHTVLSYLKRTCFRFAALSLRVQGSRRATPQSAAAASSPLRTETPLRDVPVLRSAYFHKEYTVLFAPKRSTFRFAARTLRVQGSQGSPSGGAAEGKTPAQEIAARALEAGNRDLYCIGGMSPCSVRAALRSWWRRAYSS